MKHTVKQKWLMLLLGVLLVTASAARIIWLNAQWIPAQVFTVPFGEVWDNNGIQIEVLDSVLGSAKETLEYYGYPSDNIREDDIVQLLALGWRGYVLTVKVRVTNTTAKETSLGQCMGFYAESIPWFNGEQMLALPLYNPRFDSRIPSGEAQEYVFPYIVYREHFRDGAWNRLPETEFYLVSQSIYPIKTKMICTPIFLPSAQLEFYE